MSMDIDRQDEAMTAVNALPRGDVNRLMGWIIGTDPGLVLKCLDDMAEFDAKHPAVSS